MTKKIILASLTLALGASMGVAKESSESGEFYFVTKALLTTAQTVKESNNVEVQGQTGGGVGIDLGYTLPYHFALELDTSYDQNTIREKRQTIEDEVATTEIEEAHAVYWTYALDVTYTYELTHSLGLMGKLGYEIEHETISKLNKDAQDSGMVYGAGLEYHLLKHYEALVEYEGSMIESPRGSSIYAGIKYIF
jgi:opacity protein-like surface antigen